VSVTEMDITGQQQQINYSKSETWA